MSERSSLGLDGGASGEDGGEHAAFRLGFISDSERGLADGKIRHIALRDREAANNERGLAVADALENVVAFFSEQIALF